MSEIPYGDCFTVDIRWDVTPITPPADAGDAGVPTASGMSVQTQHRSAAVKLDITLRIPFSKFTMFKKVKICRPHHFLS